MGRRFIGTVEVELVHAHKGLCPQLWNALLYAFVADHDNLPTCGMETRLLKKYPPDLAAGLPNRGIQECRQFCSERDLATQARVFIT